MSVDPTNRKAAGQDPTQFPEGPLRAAFAVLADLPRVQARSSSGRRNARSKRMIGGMLSSCEWACCISLSIGLVALVAVTLGTAPSQWLSGRAWRLAAVHVAGPGTLVAVALAVYGQAIPTLAATGAACMGAALLIATVRARRAGDWGDGGGGPGPEHPDDSPDGGGGDQVDWTAFESEFWSYVAEADRVTIAR